MPTFSVHAPKAGEESSMTDYAVLRTPLLPAVRELFRASQRNLTGVSPFVNVFGRNVLREALGGKTHKTRQLTILTSLSVRSIRDGSLDLDSLVAFCKQYQECKVQNLPGLHAKVYIADQSLAIVTSANLTRGGLVGNYEYGMLIRDGRTAARVHADMSDYANLGADLELRDLEQLAARAEELQSAAKNSEKALRGSIAWKALSSRIDALRDNLLRTRVRAKSVNSIFADTIRYILRQGPLNTVDLEWRVQATHPDMCDDTIDRVIDGVRFGKKWKHMVRNSQQFLKRKGEIEFGHGFWQLTGQLRAPKNLDATHRGGGLGQ